MLTRDERKSNRLKRHFRIRKRVVGSQARPRLVVSPSLKHFEAQLVDDFEQKTLLGFSTKAKDFQKSAGVKKTGNIKAAVAFGKYFAGKAKEKGIGKAVFDRGGYLYHWRIKAFADSARESGLSF